jgi:predicted dehydrogenase
MKTGSVAIGVIGAGIMGERMLNAILDQDPDLLHACGIWDPAAAAMRRMASVFPRLPRMDDAAAVIAASDCVYIASPPASHLDHAAAAMTAGKTFFCEKPLAVDVAAARAFVAQAGDRGAVNFPFASSLAVAAITDWIRKGGIGTPLRIDIDIGFAAWPRPWQADAVGWLDKPVQGGFTREVVSHFLFLSRRLIGPLHGLSGEASFP